VPAKIRALERQILKEFGGEDKAKVAILENLKLGDLHLATYRRELGLLKVKPAIEQIEYILENTSENILVFAYHTDVIQSLVEALEDYSPAVITGQTPMTDRQLIVDGFQNSDTRIFIGNYVAAGVGFTLTKATKVVFVEPSWVPAENQQAADRCHRIGQKNAVTVEYCVFENSLDISIMNANLYKKQLIGQIIDREIGETK
jgi:SWI/SNF-related matrix-associated actin-dependent regulator 1 of chromatin subfamily A